MRKLVTRYSRIIMAGFCIILLLIACSTATINVSPVHVAPLQSPTSTSASYQGNRKGPPRPTPPPLPLPYSTDQLPATLTPGATSTVVPSASPTATLTPGATSTVVPSASPTATLTPGATSTVVPTASPTPGCGIPSSVPVGTSADVTLAVDPQEAKGATTRTYRLHVPTDYQPQLPLPVVLIFHGRGSNPAEIEDYTGFSQLADTERFIAVYPQGLHNSTGETFWDSFSPLTEGIDEVSFVNRILDDLEQKLCVDTSRIYATGFSNGANMAGMLACRLAGRIASFAPISGNFFDNQQGCHPGRPVAILNAHGTADNVVPYATQQPTPDQPLPQPGVLEWLQQWANQDGCTTGPISFSQISNVTGMQWTNCNSDVTILHYRIEGGTHVWPKTLGNFQASETIWHFFLEYPFPYTGSSSVVSMVTGNVNRSFHHSASLDFLKRFFFCQRIGCDEQKNSNEG